MSVAERIAEPPEPIVLDGGPDPDAAVSTRALWKRYGDIEAVRGRRPRRRHGRDVRLPRPRTAPASRRRSRCSARWSGRPRAPRWSPVTTSCTSDYAVRRSIGLVFQEHDARRLPDGRGEPAVPRRRSTACRARSSSRARRGARDGRPATSGASSMCGTFSGGMKRRLEIARGLLHSPRVLFLDEPTIGLDPQTRATIWELRRASCATREDITIFLTTHYMDEAERCDRIAIIDAGTIVAGHAAGAEGRGRRRPRRASRTADDGAAIAALRERVRRRRQRVREGERHVPRARRRAVRAEAVRRARRADPLGQRRAARRSTTCSWRTPAAPSATPSPLGARRQPPGRARARALVAGESRCPREPVAAPLGPSSPPRGSGATCGPCGSSGSAS